MKTVIVREKKKEFVDYEKKYVLIKSLTRICGTRQFSNQTQ